VNKIVKVAKFVAVDEGEFGFAITDNDELMILDVENNTEKSYSKSFVNELIDFLFTHWDD